MPPWLRVNTCFPGWWYSCTRETVLAEVSTPSVTPRLGRSGMSGKRVLPPLSKAVIVPSPCGMASCCPIIHVPGPMSKLLRFPPSRHTTRPLWRLMSKSAFVFRAETSRWSLSSTAIVFAWNGSFGLRPRIGKVPSRTLTSARLCHSK